MNFQQILDVDLKEGQGLLAEMNTSGDTRIIWNRNNADEVDIARESFRKARAKGMAAYRVTGKEGVKGEVISEFDPDAERIILAPPLRGGKNVGRG